MKVTMTQHPVGQGGLFCGEIEAQFRPLRWVYDCGSNQKDALTREITEVADGGEIDLLFLSHLDSDHINGVDQLLAGPKVNEVILPYLDAGSLLATIGKDASHGKLTGSFIEAALDVAGWFGRRGVDRITFVGGPEDDRDDGETRPALPRDPDDGGDFSPSVVKTKWVEVPNQTQKAAGWDRLPKGRDKLRADVRHVENGSFLSVMDEKTEVLNWILKPYAHLPSKRKMDAFKKALADNFGPRQSFRQFAELARDQYLRDVLRECYDAIWLDHNLVSLSLYSGPIHQTLPLSTLRYSWRQNTTDLLAGGWMLTGDAQLRGVRRRRKFLENYSSFLESIAVLMLPHHGSIHNHSDLTFTGMTNLAIGYAAAGPNTYNHPHSDVIQAVSAHPRAQFHQVSDNRLSRLTLTQDI